MEASFFKYVPSEVKKTSWKNWKRKENRVTARKKKRSRSRSRRRGRSRR